MLAIADRQRPQFPTIYSVYESVEEFWDACPPDDDTASTPDDLFNPLDACVIHLLLEKLSSVPVYVDLALAATGAASTVFGLVHPRVELVVVENADECAALQRVQKYAAKYGARLAFLKTLPASDLVSREALVPGTVILADARSQDPEELADQISSWLETQPNLVILLLELGRLGGCPALAAVWRTCSSKLSHRIWLARELSPVLSKSSLGIIARKENQEVADALVRIEQLYTSNYHFLDLLRTQNQVLLEASGVDAELMELPHVRCHFTAEMEECRRLTEEAQEMRTQLAEANRRLAEAASDRAARKQQLEALESSNQAARHRLEALESSNQAARQQLEALESSNQGARQQLEALESSIAFKTALRVRRSAQDLLRNKAPASGAIGG